MKYYVSCVVPTYLVDTVINESGKKEYYTTAHSPERVEIGWECDTNLRAFCIFDTLSRLFGVKSLKLELED
jgi:hypothetical protein